MFDCLTIMYCMSQNAFSTIDLYARNGAQIGINMRACIAFIKKEFVESVRTYKLLIILSVFVLFGMLNPVTAKILPQILLSVMPEGMNITLPEPGAIDSWTQFYKNMTGMQIIVFVIVFSGIVSNEISKGTLINMLTKGLSRKTVIISKMISTTVIWTLGYVLSFVFTYGYTVYLFPENLPNQIFSGFCMWLFGVLVTAVMLLGGVIFSNIYGAILSTGGIVVLLIILNIFPGLQKYNPYRLASNNLELLTGGLAVQDFYAAIGVTCFLILMGVICAVFLFDKRKM